MKTRIISAVVASIIGVIILILNKTVVFPIAIAILTTLMLYELFHAEGCMNFKITTLLCFLFSMALPFFNYNIIKKYVPALVVLILIAVFVTFLVQYKTLPFDKLSFMIVTTLLITFAMNSLIMIKNSDKEHGLFYLILALLGAWLADSGAYFAGTLFGKHKLCPEISPKKTVEGLVGGTVVNAILFIIIGILYTKIEANADVIIHMNYVYLAVLGMICSLLGLLGDLTASLIKRQNKIKDYGNIMPGHGGVMDRFDSVLFVVPFMYLALQFINIIK